MKHLYDNLGWMVKIRVQMLLPYQAIAFIR